MEFKILFLNFVADFGEMVTLIGPMAIIFIFLGASRQYILSAIWIISLSLIFIASFFLKGGACIFVGPGYVSGHSSMSTAFYGGIAAIFYIFANKSQFTILYIIISIIIIGSISWSVYELGWHDFNQIGIGIFIGGACPVSLLIANRRIGSFERNGPAIIFTVFSCALLIGLLHGTRIKEGPKSRFCSTFARQGVHIDESELSSFGARHHRERPATRQESFPISSS